MSALIAPLEIVRDQILDRFLESCIKNYPLEGYLQRFERLELAHLPMQA